MDHLLTSIGAYEDVEGANPWRPGSRQGVKGDNKQNVMSKSVKSFDFFQPVFSPNHAKLDICERLDYGRVQWGYKDDVLRYLLFNGGTVTTEQIQVLERHGIGPFNLAAYGYQSSFVGEVDMRLRTLVREMVKKKADLHFEQQPNALPQHMRGVDGYPFSTPFFAVLIPDSWYPYHYECSRDLQKKIRRSMLCWLQDLQICGVDLEQFGKIEKKVFRKHKILKERWYPFNQWMQLSDFKYGPDPEDWMLEWDSVAEDYAGKFWYFVEEQLQSPELPGAWVDSLPEYGWEGVGYYDADSHSSGSGVEDDVVDQKV
ncbi:hypothetical protein E8E14_003573 [Neopestalotiopsis sp. 37M]|nr:hypothetical protein E8E14_003573 [Neopestalotiopsis sp. 37M]